MRNILASAALAAAAFAASGPALASEAAANEASAAGWAMRPYTVYDRDDRDKPEDQRRINYSGVIVHTTDAGGPGALLNCSDKFGLSVMFSFGPVDFADQDYFASSNQVRALGGRLIVDGERPREPSRFLLRRKLNVAQAAKPDRAYETVDAIYTRKSIEVAVDGMKPTTVDLPAPDASFTEFVKSCPGFVSN